MIEDTAPPPKRARATRLLARYGTLIVALSLLVLFGGLAEYQARQTAHQSQRAEVAARMELVRVGLETEVERELRHLTRFAGRVSAGSAMDAEGFDRLARPVLEADNAISGLMLLPADAEAPALLAGAPATETRVVDLVRAGALPGATGSRTIAANPGPVMALWTPVTDEEPDAPGQGHVAALLGTEALFRAAGLRDGGSGLDFALSALEADSATSGRAVHLGHPAVISDGPVIAIVRIPGGDWALFGRPAGGWDAGAGSSWPIRLMTLLSIGLVGVPMLRTRRLMDEHRDTIRDLHASQVDLEKAGQRLSLALTTSRIGVWEYCVETGKVIWDARMNELYGFPPVETLRRYEDWCERLHPDGAAGAIREFREAIKGSKHYESRFCVVLPDGRLRHIRAIADSFRTIDGQHKFVGVNWDVTAEVHQRNELEARRRQAEADSSAKSRFLATMSHEIRTPMGGVAGLLDLMLREDLPEAQRARAELARESTRHLTTILNDLLDFSRLSDSGVTLNPVPENVARLTEDVAALMRPLAEARGVHIVTEIDPALPGRVLVDPMRLRQILTNLVGNAVKFTDTGTITVALGVPEGQEGLLEARVTDSGIGIPGTAIPILFDRYSRVEDPGSPAREGTGLGLAICRELVERMGGEISVDSTLGQGSTFRFRIPAPAAPDHDEAGATAPAREGRRAQHLHRLRHPAPPAARSAQN